jgi:hypothetical protein
MVEVVPVIKADVPIYHEWIGILRKKSKPMPPRLPKGLWSRGYLRPPLAPC